VAIDIDAAAGEGGGQVLRSAVTLALLTGSTVSLYNVRANRSPPGVRPQHLQAVAAAARVSDAQVAGLRVGSRQVRFAPGTVRPGDYFFDIGTAGATSLVLQTVYLPLMLAGGPSTVTIAGGTHVPFSPCFHYLDMQWRPFLQRLGLKLGLQMKRAGFYPPGGGLMTAVLEPADSVQPIRLARRGALQAVDGLSAVANLDAEIGLRQRRRALQRLQAEGIPCELDAVSLPAVSAGTVLVLRARCACSQACFFALGRRGKRAEQVADEAVAELLAFLATDGAVDPYLADQLLLPLALAGGPSELTTSRVTTHLCTNGAIIERFMPVTVQVQGAVGEPGTVRVRPARGSTGHTAQHPGGNP